MRGALVFLLVCIAVGSALALPTAHAETSPARITFAPMLPPIPTGGTRLAAPDPAPLDDPFGPNVRASENDVLGNQNEITMAVASDGRIHMGWNDLQSTNPDYRCGYAYSTDGGATWSANRLFHMPPYDADGDPVVVVDSNNVVYFICMAFYRGGGSEVVSYRSADGGITFAPGVVVSDTTSGFNDKPWAHAVGTTVYACWTNFVGGGTEFRYTYSADGGATWAPSRVLDYNGQGCTFAHNDAGNLYAAWQRGNNIYAFRSLDGGGTWGAGAHFVGGAPFTDSPNQRAYNMPSLAANRATSGVYAVWTANDGAGGWDVRFSGSTDGAITWSTPLAVNDVRTGHQFMPSIGVDVGGTLHVAWYDDRSGLMAVRYASSSNGGSSWVASLRVTDMEWPTTYFLGDYITLVADAMSHVNIAWADHRSGENEAYFARSSSAGPPRLARIDVTAPEAWTDADTPVSFTASGFNQYGQLFPINPIWQATGGSIASGSYVPDFVGDWQVWANQSGVSGAAVVHVAPGALARIEVVPADATITADDSQLYGAMGFDSHGNPRTITPSWGASDGTVLPYGGPDGRFLPQRVGVWTVYANASGLSGTASVTVTPGRLAAIFVSPSAQTITADDVQQYVASGQDAKGNAVAVVAPIWQATGGAISGSGLYTAQRAGVWTVWANATNPRPNSTAFLSGSASLVVLPGVLARIEVAPQDVAVPADQTVQYTARGYDAKGNELAILPAWAASAGTIDSSGLYTPGPVGLHAITATAGGVAASTSVTVRAGALARIDVAPSPVTITADDLLPLTASGYDVRGNSVAVSPAWAATCGTVDPSGVYAPGPARLCTAYANESGISGSARITVTPGRLARIDLSPSVAQINADQTLLYRAAGYDAKGNEVVIAPLWSAEEGGMDPQGRYTPGLAGTWEVRATVDPVVGTGLVTVTAGLPSRLVVLPGEVTITADQRQSFEAYGFDRAGNPSGLSSLSWAVEDGAISSGGLFTPHHVGPWTVTATAGALQGTARVTVHPGAVASVVLQPPEARTQEGRTVRFGATAKDAKGNDVPDATFAWRVEGGVGAIDASGRFSATHGGQGLIIVTASGGSGSASAQGSVVVDAAPVGILPWILLALLIVPVVLVAWWARRRRQDAAPPGRP